MTLQITDQLISTLLILISVFTSFVYQKIIFNTHAILIFSYIYCKLPDSHLSVCNKPFNKADLEIKAQPELWFPGFWI